MKTETQTFETLVPTVKTKTTKNQVKRNVVVVETKVETVETTKIKIDKNEQLFSTLSKLTNLSVEQLKTFAILNLAKRKVKTNLTKFLTTLILNVASSKLEIKETESKMLNEFLTKISEQSKIEIEQLKSFLIFDFAKTSKKVLLRESMIELFFNVVSNKNNIQETIAKF